MRQGLLDNVFPGAVLLVSKNGRVIFFEAYGYAHPCKGSEMTRETFFDLASLTKPLATTLAVMKLVQEKKITLDQNLATTLPLFKNTDKGGITIRHLLSHSSGLPPYRPYYLEMHSVPPGNRQALLRGLLVKEALVNPIGGKMVYSDLGFMILAWLVETVSGRSFDGFVTGEIYHPLGLDDLFFIKTDPARSGKKIAVTELCPWRNLLLEGVVHDENAFVQGGIAGHAGLFGTAADIQKLLRTLAAAYHGECRGNIFQKDLVHQFFRRDPIIGRPLGFDAPSRTDSSCGRHFSDRSVGHLGFTGTSFWMDLMRSVIVVLLTNRVHPTRENIKIKTFRPKVHDMIMENVIGTPFPQ